MTETLEAVAGRRETPTARLVLSVDAPRTEWLEARRAGIAATDVVAILGQSKYRNALDVWTDKTMPLNPDDAAGEAAFWGTRLEEPVAQAWAERHDVKIRRVGLVAHEAEPWMLASLDRLVSGCPDGRCALEVKTRSLFVAADWERALPQDVRVQVWWQLMVSGLDHIHVAALIGGQRLVEHRVDLPPADEALRIRNAAAAVWQAVQANTPPDLPAELWTTDFLDARYAGRDGSVEVDGAAVEVLAEYEQVNAQLTELEARKAELRTQLVGALGDAEAATYAGQTLYTYRAATRRSLNAKAAVAAFPELADTADCWTTTTTRALRVAKEGSK